MKIGAPEILSFLPLCMLIAPALLMLVLELAGAKVSRLLWLESSCLSAWIVSLFQLYGPGTVFCNFVYLDSFGWLFKTIILLGASLTFLGADRYFGQERIKKQSDLSLLLILATAGSLVMVDAANLLVFFLGFELLSLSVYVLTGSARGEAASAEGAMKYFFLGAFSSAFMLYGIALVYGSAGTLAYSGIAPHVSSGMPVLFLGLGFILFGLAFKMSVVPFHLWCPDVYQGAPVSITTFMASVVKVAAFASFLRFSLIVLRDLPFAWLGIIWLISFFTMSLGNLVALRQQSLKRMLAYSSIAHAGYLTIGFLILKAEGASATIAFYLLTYTLATIAVFAVLLIVVAGSSAQYQEDNIGSMNGIGWKYPLLGFAMTVALLSLAGLPPFAGFMAKFYLFYGAIQSGYTLLVVAAVINSLISLYYYLRVIVVMYIYGERKVAWPEGAISWSATLALATTSFLTIYLGLFSEKWLLFIRAAVRM